MSLKPLGRHLVEAGLLHSSQVEVALRDQQQTRMRFGEILAARGWVKQQTIDYLMRKIVLPERQRATSTPPPKNPRPTPPAAQPQTHSPSPVRLAQQKQITANFPDDDIPWVD